MPVFRIGEAAHLLGVSDDTLRRWADAGRFASTTTESGRRGVDDAELARFAPRWPSIPRKPYRTCPRPRATSYPAWSPGSSGIR
ncbi:MAG: helix-turn-helix domain-containing protein [Actinomycetota bacterium]|nr:helix-turn-helix domain-containing protein [Actinomycetota bacterium]